MIKADDDLVKRYDALETERAPWLSHWDTIRKYAHPAKAVNINAPKPAGTGPNADTMVRLFDSSSVIGCQELAAAFVHWLCDPSEVWFRLSSPVEDEAAKQACDKAGKVLRDALADSNFYVAIHQAALERCGPGTGCMVIGLGEDGLEMESWRCGSYVFWQDPRGKLLGWIAKVHLTAEQALAEYGDKVPDKVRHDAGDPGRRSAKHEFLRSYWRRTREELDSISREAAEAGSPLAMPVGSCVIHKESKTCVREGGMREMPVAVSPYEVWPSDDSSSELWGYSPGFMCLAEQRTANQMRLYMLEHAALASGPRVLIPTGHQGPVDLGRHGITRVQDMRDRPTEWGQVADMRTASVELDRSHAILSRIWQGNLVQQFGKISHQMTATEVNARQAEALVLFAPTVALMMRTQLQPILEAAFSLLYHAGAMPEFPPSMQEGGVQLAPKVKFTSRLVLALEALQVGGFTQSLAEGVQLAASGVSVLDNLDVDKGFRAALRARGVDPELIVDETARDDRRRASAEAAQQQQQAAMMLEAAKTPVAKALVS